MTVIIYRSLIFYILLTAMMRFMGKRQIGEMQVSELVTTVFLSELAVYPVTDQKVPILYGVVPVVMISTLEVVLSFIALKSGRFRKFLNGDAITLYENGSFIRKNLFSVRMSQEDVEAQVRINGFENLGMVKTIILERTGKMSVIPKDDPTPNQSGE